MVIRGCRWKRELSLRYLFLSQTAESLVLNTEGQIDKEGGIGGEWKRGKKGEEKKERKEREKTESLYELLNYNPFNTVQVYNTSLLADSSYACVLRLLSRKKL